MPALVTARAKSQALTLTEAAPGRSKAYIRQRNITCFTLEENPMQRPRGLQCTKGEETPPEEISVEGCFQVGCRQGGKDVHI